MGSVGGVPASAAREGSPEQLRTSWLVPATDASKRAAAAARHSRERAAAPLRARQVPSPTTTALAAPRQRTCSAAGSRSAPLPSSPSCPCTPACRRRCTRPQSGARWGSCGAWQAQGGREGGSRGVEAARGRRRRCSLPLKLKTACRRIRQGNAGGAAAASTPSDGAGSRPAAGRRRRRRAAAAPLLGLLQRPRVPKVEQIEDACRRGAAGAGGKSGGVENPAHYMWAPHSGPMAGAQRAPPLSPSAYTRRGRSEGVPALLGPAVLGPACSASTARCRCALEALLGFAATIAAGGRCCSRCASGLARRCALEACKKKKRAIRSCAWMLGARYKAQEGHKRALCSATRRPRGRAKLTASRMLPSPAAALRCLSGPAALHRGKATWVGNLDEGQAPHRTQVTPASPPLPPAASPASALQTQTPPRSAPPTAPGRRRCTAPAGSGASGGHAWARGVGTSSACRALPTRWRRTTHRHTSSSTDLQLMSINTAHPRDDADGGKAQQQARQHIRQVVAPACVGWRQVASTGTGLPSRAAQAAGSSAPASLDPPATVQEGRSPSSTAAAGCSPHGRAAERQRQRPGRHAAAQPGPAARQEQRRKECHKGRAAAGGAAHGWSYQ